MAGYQTVEEARVLTFEFLTYWTYDPRYVWLYWEAPRDPRGPLFDTYLGKWVCPSCPSAF